jgi:O-antigen/teichoic acid export membrane protein
MNKYKNKVVKGLSWNALNQLSKQILSIASTMILARVLLPDDFGIIGMVVVFTGFAELFLNFGFGMAIIQKKEVTQLELSSMFWVNLFLGVLLSLIFFFSASFLASFYEKQIIEGITKLISINFFLRSFVVVQNSLFRRKLNFKILAIANVIGLLTSKIVIISLALCGFGVWSLAFESITLSLVLILILWIRSDWKPKFIFSLESLREVYGFSINVSLARVLQYWSKNVDNFIVGKVLGSISLGYYSRSYRIMLLPVNNISTMLANVMFPAFSRIQDDLERIRMIYLKLTKMITLISIPMMVIVFLGARELTLIIFGSAWLAIVPIIKIMSLMGAVQSVYMITDSVYKAINKTNILVRVSLTRLFLLCVTVYFGSTIYGIEGAAFAYFITEMIVAFISFYFIQTKLGLRLFTQILNLRHPFFGGLIMTGSYYIIHPYVQNVFFMNLFLLLLLVIIYTFYIYIFERSFIKYILKQRKKGKEMPIQ